MPWADMVEWLAFRDGWIKGVLEWEMILSGTRERGREHAVFIIGACVIVFRTWRL